MLAKLWRALTGESPRSGLDRGAGAGGNLVGRDREGPVNSAVSQDLDRPALPRQPHPGERFRGHRGAGLEAVQVGDVDDVVLDPEDVGEAPLGHPPVEGHLPAFEAPLVAVPAARLLSLAAAARGLTVAAGGNPADALSRARWAGRGAQVMDAGGRGPRT